MNPWGVLTVNVPSSLGERPATFKCHRLAMRPSGCSPVIGWRLLVTSGVKSIQVVVEGAVKCNMVQRLLSHEVMVWRRLLALYVCPRHRQASPGNACCLQQS